MDRNLCYFNINKRTSIKFSSPVQEYKKGCKRALVLTFFDFWDVFGGVCGDE